MELEIEESEEQRGRGTFDRAEKRVDRDSEQQEPAARYRIAYKRVSFSR